TFSLYNQMVFEESLLQHSRKYSQDDFSNTTVAKQSITAAKHPFVSSTNLLSQTPNSKLILN
ncbi:MAG: hypothetical protein AAF990_21265, partial [Bacteroidota bacterium]